MRTHLIAWLVCLPGLALILLALFDKLDMAWGVAGSAIATLAVFINQKRFSQKNKH